MAVRWLRRADFGIEEIACRTAQNLYSLHRSRQFHGTVRVTDASGHAASAVWIRRANASCATSATSVSVKRPRPRMATRSPMPDEVVVERLAQYVVAVAS